MVIPEERDGKLDMDPALQSEAAAAEAATSRKGGLPQLPDQQKVRVKREQVINKLSELRRCVKVKVDILGYPIPNSPHGLCGRKVALNLNWWLRAQELCEGRGGHPGLLIPVSSPHGHCGIKATLHLK